jgi:phenylacetate-CoA ligase
MDLETKLNTPEMKEIQWHKMKRRIEQLYTRTSFWRSMMDEDGVRPKAIKTWDEFHKGIRIFTKEHYRGYAAACGNKIERILEGLLGKDSERLACIAATSGTTGEPTPYPFLPEDLHTSWGEYAKRFLWRCGVFPGDRVLHGFGFSMFTAGIPLCMSIADYGSCVIPVGAEAGTESILKWAHQFRPKAMTCTPSLAEYMIQKARDVTIEEVDALNIKILLCGGEPGAGIPEVREKIEDAFKAKLYDIGGGGCSCNYPEYQGMHYLIDDLSYMEIVDPKTHEHVPMEDGAVGLVAHTQLEGGIVYGGLRQTSNDIIKVFTSPCPCGKNGFRFKVIGRADDMLKVKGVMVYPPAIEGVINSFVPRITGEFRIVLEEPPPRVKPPLKLKIEYGTGMKEEALDSLAEEVAEAMHKQTKIRPKIVWLPPQALERSEKKKKVFEKKYEQ